MPRGGTHAAIAPRGERRGRWLWGARGRSRQGNAPVFGRARPLRRVSSGGGTVGCWSPSIASAYVRSATCTEARRVWSGRPLWLVRGIVHCTVGCTVGCIVRGIVRCIVHGTTHGALHGKSLGHRYMTVT